jgi:hypothetical protein
MNIDAEVRNKVEKLLDTKQLLRLEPEEFDERLLDVAKEGDHAIVATADGRWIIRFFHARVDFVQIQSPNGKIHYMVKHMKEGKQVTFKMFLEGKNSGDIMMLKNGYYMERDSASGENLHSWFIRRLMEDDIIGSAKQRLRRDVCEWNINIPSRDAYNDIEVARDEVFEDLKFKWWVTNNLAALRIINLRGPSAD